MNRLCILKATKKILEMQSGGDDIPDLMEMRLNTLKQNAINAGHKEEDVDVKWVTDAEYATAKAEDPNEIARIADQAAKQAEQAAKAQAFVDNLPSRAKVKEWIDAAFPDVKQNAFMTKLCNVVYWDTKGTAD